MLTQTLLQRFYISALWPALPALFIVGAGMAETGACATAGTHAVAFELALPADHAGEALGLGDAGVVGDGGVAGDGIEIVGRTLALLGAVGGRPIIRSSGHGEDVSESVYDASGG